MLKLVTMWVQTNRWILILNCLIYYKFTQDYIVIANELWVNFNYYLFPNKLVEEISNFNSSSQRIETNEFDHKTQNTVCSSNFLHEPMFSWIIKNSCWGQWLSYNKVVCHRGHKNTFYLLTNRSMYFWVNITCPSKSRGSWILDDDVDDDDVGLISAGGNKKPFFASLKMSPSTYHGVMCMAWLLTGKIHSINTSINNNWLACGTIGQIELIEEFLVRIVYFLYKIAQTRNILMMTPSLNEDPTHTTHCPLLNGLSIFDPPLLLLVCIRSV